MPSSETIELVQLNDKFGKTSDVPGTGATSSLLSRIRTLLLNIGNVPILKHIYGGNAPDETLTLTGEHEIRGIFVDGTYLYTAMNSVIGTVPGKIIKIDLSTFKVYDTYTSSFNDDVVALFSDGTNLYATLAGLVADPSYVIKINLQTFQEIASITLPIGSQVGPMFSDGTSLYVGGMTTPGEITEVDVESFTVSSTITLAAGENYVRSLFADDSFLYATLVTNPSKVVKIDLDTFTTVSTLTLTGLGAYGSFIDGTNLYICCDGGITAGNITKIDTRTFTVSSVLTLNIANLETLPHALFSDGTYLYVAVYSSPAHIVVIDLATFTRISSISLTTDYVGSLSVDGSFLYAGSETDPGVVTRTYLLPTNTATDRQIDIIHEQTKTGTYYIAPALAVGAVVNAGADIATKGAYTEVITANTITNNFYIEAVFFHKVSVAGQNYEVDIATGGAGSEIVIATVSTEVASTSDSKEYVFSNPIKVLANTRISSRASCQFAGQIILIKIRYRI